MEGKLVAKLISNQDKEHLKNQTLEGMFSVI